MDSNWDQMVNENMGSQSDIVIGGKEEKKIVPRRIDNFEDMNIKENLLRGIYGYGFEKPSKIQQLTIPVIFDGKDLVAQSQSGTGKTGAFSIGILQRINEKENFPQAIILAPTRELSQQINSVFTDIGSYLQIKTALCVGGSSVEDNIAQAKKSHCIIGTPGRIIDLIERNTFDVSKIKIFSLDEADVLLEKEFVTQTRKIVKKLHKNAQICVFSATLTPESIAMTQNFMNKNTVHMLIEPEKLSLELIAQNYIFVGEENYKIETLNDLYERLSIGQCIIYVNGVDKAIWLKEQLTESGHSVEAMHSKLSPLERTEIMKSFRGGNYRVLVSTDLLARGIDIQQVSYVINYDLPHDVSNYIHRIGRSGRFGKKGISINFVTKRDFRQQNNISTYYKCNITEMPDPDELNKYLDKR
jgi:translation initiation factor 4A